MSEEIKVGEYARTLDGNIGKIEQINKEPTDDNVIYVVTDNWVGMYEEIVKHSKDIIDLIQVGDYVNGNKVELSRYNELYTSYVYCGGVGFRTTEAYATFVKDMEVEDIESIITREQFERMEYKVNE